MSSPTLYLMGFKPPDEKWKKMKAIWDACEAAKVDPPRKVEEFFDGEPPEDTGVALELGKGYDKKGLDILREYSDEMKSGYEFDLKDLPPDVKTIRAYIGW